jgi:hypothetical protein
VHLRPGRQSHIGAHEFAWTQIVGRENSIRIVPDLLGDTVLAEAALDVRSGVPTGHIRRVLDCVEGDRLLQGFVNVSRVDCNTRVF